MEKTTTLCSIQYIIIITQASKNVKCLNTYIQL